MSSIFFGRNLYKKYGNYPKGIPLKTVIMLSKGTLTFDEIFKGGKECWLHSIYYFDANEFP